jgi:uncharacterized protein (TIGR02001 family)
MKKIAFIVALSLASAAALRADDLQVSLDVPFASKYVFRGVELTPAAIQPDLEISTGDQSGPQGYGGVWGNYPLDTNTKNEFDFYGGYRWPVLPGSDWKLDAGVTIYDLPQGFYTPHESDSSEEIYLGLMGGTATVADGRIVLMPTAYVYHDFTREDYTAIGALGFSFPLERLGTAVNVTLKVGGVTAQRTPDYTFGGTDVEVPYRVGPNTTLTVGGHYATSDLENVGHNLFTFTAGVTYRF